MGEMKSSRKTEVFSAQQLNNPSIGPELSTAWKSLAQTKAALRHIENRLEATPGTGVLMESVMDPPKKKSTRRVHCRDGQQADSSGGSSKRRGRSQQSPEKSSSRSPLRNSTQDSNVRRNNSVEFREPLASYREATPPPHPSSQLEAYSLQSVPGSLHPSSPASSDPLLSQLVYQRDTRDKQTDRDLESTHSSALESTEVRYLNDQPAPVTLRTIVNQSPLTGVEGAEEERTPKAHVGMDSQKQSLFETPAQGSVQRAESTPSSSPGSASQRLENLRRHQPDDKLEKLKERIRRQRQHLEEAAEKEKLLGYLEQPITAAVGSNSTGTASRATAKIRKVAAAPPAPVYKGFNSTETKIRTPDGRVWKEEDFHNLSREIYRDLSQQFAETTRSKNLQQREQRADRSKERRPPKPVRKVHRAAPSSDLNAKPVINTSSWREGQKLVKMVLGPFPKSPMEERPQPADGLSRTASHHHFSSEPRTEAKPRSRPNSRERPTSSGQGRSKSRYTNPTTPSSADQDREPECAGADLLSSDIQGILDDLQLECRAAEREERARQRSRCSNSSRRGGSGSRTRAPISAWGTTLATGSSSRGCRSASPTIHRPHTASTADTGNKKRHYDADSVRQYILKQQEERKKRRAEEKRTLREETERRNQRLQELYRKQREAAKTVTHASEAPVAPVQKRLQETYTKLLEEVQQGMETTQTLPTAPSSHMRPVYQPSGESDKENKRLETPLSPSSSDRSFNDQPAPPPLSRNDLDVGVASLLQPDRLSPAVRPMIGPSSSLTPFGDPFLSQLLGLESAMAAGNIQQTQRPATAPSSRSRSKMSRIEALKATATSLSNRIESEARKLAGEGINYGAKTSMDDDIVLTPRPSTANADGCWTAATENNDAALKFQRSLTNAGPSSYDPQVLPGVGNLHTFSGKKKTKGAHTSFTKPHTTPADVTGPNLTGFTHERSKLVNGFREEDRMAQRSEYGLMDEKNLTDLHDSSAGSISEGPLLSEGSFSEDEAGPPRSSNNRAPKSADHPAAVNNRAEQRGDSQRLSEFQREAARCSALSSPFAQHEGSKAAWEELNKGSPLSVINIYIKNLYDHAKANERMSEKTPPSAHSMGLGNGPVDTPVYEDDFVSSHSSGQLKRSPHLHSVNTHFEELMRRSPYEKSTGGANSNHSSFLSSVHSPHPSSGSTSCSSPFSKHSSRKRGTVSDQSDATLVGEQRNSCSPPSDALSSDSRKRGSEKSPADSHAKSFHSHDALGETSQQSLVVDSKKSFVVRPKHTSSHGSPDSGSPPGSNSPSEAVRRGSLRANSPNTSTNARSGRAENRTAGQLQYSPAVLQMRMAAELQYLESIEESVRQLGDVERLMGVSMAQQESASLAQMLKAKQQNHERDLYELKIKAEREALEAQLQIEENRQRAARAHTELQESLAGTQKETLEGLQEATAKMMSQQAETARYTAETARHIKEMTEMARSQIAGALVVPPAVTSYSVSDDQRNQQSSFSPQRQDESDSFLSHESSRRTGPEESLSPLNSLSHSDSQSFRRPNFSGADSSSHHSPSCSTSDQKERTKKEAAEGKGRKEGTEVKEAASSSIEEEAITAANDSLCSDSIQSVLEEKADSTSVATEYSFKFDESMTEDEIEERSFRSLLPSEAHRRGTKDKKSRHREESEDDEANHGKTTISGAHNILKDAKMAFSGGQDSFSQFTMDMVRQYMKDGEVRLHHQSSLLHLRQKALKDKTRAELAWLEHQKKRLRDKGEDDKMPPIRKKQRGLLIKLQQEQAEIKRLQEANKAARKERQLLLKQQEEIERMRNSTLRLKERLKCAGSEAPPETPVSEALLSESASTNIGHAEDGRSPSPSLSISGSETSSIMQKLKKMRCHMDEKFLTKREQQLMQRRHHAEELLQWKQRLDQEEAEVCRMEKEALAVWERNTPKDKKGEMSDISPSARHHQSTEPRTDSEKEYASEGDGFSPTSESSIHTEGPESQQLGSPSGQPASVHETPLASVQSSPANYTQDFTLASHSLSRQSVQSPFKGSHSPSASPSDGSSKTRMHPRFPSRTPNQAHTQQTDSLMATQTEPISDQSDIESRIKALKEELRKRKFMAYQLKKEQKKRHKERLKAQEASLLKQLESYDNFIEKTKAELNKEPDSTPDSRSLIKDSTSISEQSSIKPASHRSETSKISEPERRPTDASRENNLHPQLGDSRSTSVPEEFSDEDPPTVTPTPVQSSPECPGLKRPSSHKAHTSMNESEEEGNLFHLKSGIQEEREVNLSSQLEDQQFQHLQEQGKEDTIDSQRKLSKTASPSSSEEKLYSPSVSIEQGNQIKPSETSRAEEAIKSSSIASSRPHSALMDLKTSSQRLSSSSSNHSCSPDSVVCTSKNEAHVKDDDTASPIADCYQVDFESSVDCSARGELQKSKPASQTSTSITEKTGSRKGSQNDEVEEEIAEDLSHHSGISVNSIQSGRMSDLDTLTGDSAHDKKDRVQTSRSPSTSPPHRDEMPSFDIGDRVLVGGVQPGTLRFKGPTSFANGFWAGVELDKSEGNNNGTYDNIEYFKCSESHGIFAPPDKITHLPEMFEIYPDTTEDEDSFFDDLSDKSGNKQKAGRDKNKNLKNKREATSIKTSGSGDKKITEEPVHKDGSTLNSEHNKESEQLNHNGSTADILLDNEEAPLNLLIIGTDKGDLQNHNQKESAAVVERRDVGHPCQLIPADLSTDIRKQDKDRDLLDTCADKLLQSFVKDAVEQFAQIKKTKDKKIQAANQMNGELFGEHAEEEEEGFPSVEQKDGLPFFLATEKEELSSPELYNRPESPVLGASGQEELAKRLAELELSRELLNDLGDDQDWFDEDFGLSSRREQQRLKQQQRQEEEEARLGRPGSSAGTALGGLTPSPSGELQVKTPPRPEPPLPLPPKLPEQPAMVVPHSATEVEKMVHAATQEIWHSCGLGKEGVLAFTQLSNPQPSQEYLGKEASSQDQKALSIRSYRKAVYDLTWEMLQEIYAEDPNTDQPQWVKPRRIKSSFHRVKTAGDIAKVQEFITTEVLNLYGLTKDQCQKNDWQKMLKFGRKKRDRVDHILVQELHEEEAQWVNYDEDELFVKMQLADSIFDALLKDTANVLTLIYDKRAKVDALS